MPAEMKSKHCNYHLAQEQFQTILPSLGKLYMYAEQLATGPFMPVSVQQKFIRSLGLFFTQIGHQRGIMPGSSDDTLSVSSTENTRQQKLTGKRRGSDTTSPPKKIKSAVSSPDIFGSSDKENCESEDDNSRSSVMPLTQRYYSSDPMSETSQPNVQVDANRKLCLSPISMLQSFKSETQQEDSSDRDYYRIFSARLLHRKLKLMDERIAIADRLEMLNAERIAIEGKVTKLDAERTVLNTRVAKINEQLADIKADEKILDKKNKKHHRTAKILKDENME